MRNEKILIFGDSYSTFQGYIPEGYACYYPREANGSVNDVSQTWWHMLAAETDSEIVLNNSWSGSTICNTGYQGDCSKTSSFICRLEKLIDSGFFKENQIDRVLVLGGTNDAGTGNTRGKPKFSDWTEEDLRLVLPGVSYFMHRLSGVVAPERIHVILNSMCLCNGLLESFQEICAHCGLSSTVLPEIETKDGHPTVDGMKVIKNCVLADLG